jgi:hypothetical protein
MCHTQTIIKPTLEKNYMPYYSSPDGKPEGEFLVTKFEFRVSFGMSLEGDGHEVEVMPNLELLVTFGMSLDGVCHELYT